MGGRIDLMKNLTIHDCKCSENKNDREFIILLHTIVCNTKTSASSSSPILNVYVHVYAQAHKQNCKRTERTIEHKWNRNYRNYPIISTAFDNFGRVLT